MAPLRKRCWRVAIGHLRRASQQACDMCAETGQMLDNIRHTRMAAVMMANWLIENVGRYQSLEYFR
ncbi:MAG: hypothetical protein WCK05_12270 [Planctomycetota bacterium]|jgi:hypothetical protein